MPADDKLAKIAELKKKMETLKRQSSSLNTDVVQMYMTVASTSHQTPASSNSSRSKSVNYGGQSPIAGLREEDFANLQVTPRRKPVQQQQQDNRSAKQKEEELRDLKHELEELKQELNKAHKQRMQVEVQLDEARTILNQDREKRLKSDEFRSAIENLKLELGIYR